MRFDVSRRISKPLSRGISNCVSEAATSSSTERPDGIPHQAPPATRDGRVFHHLRPRTTLPVFASSPNTGGPRVEERERVLFVPAPDPVHVHGDVPGRDRPVQKAALPSEAQSNWGSILYGRPVMK
ncbi:MAG TPA: hypothetical protein VHG08_11600 [Longimicrobium sp.]|nr:hypothetical protein [Longimicrobium sp.]